MYERTNGRKDAAHKESIKQSQVEASLKLEIYPERQRKREVPLCGGYRRRRRQS